MALLLDPNAQVGDSELQVLAEAVRAGPETMGAPVLDRRDGNAQIGGELAGIEQGL